MTNTGNGTTLRAIAAEYDRREEALAELAGAFDDQLTTLCGLEPESVVERRLYNAIAKVIGMPPQCTIEEDFVYLPMEPDTAGPTCLGDEIAQQEHSMKTVNAATEAVPQQPHTTIFRLTDEQRDLLCTCLMHAKEDVYVAGAEKNASEERAIDALFDLLVIEAVNTVAEALPEFSRASHHS